MVLVFKKIVCEIFRKYNLLEDLPNYVFLKPATSIFCPIYMSAKLLFNSLTPFFFRTILKKKLSKMKLARKIRDISQFSTIDGIS